MKRLEEIKPSVSAFFIPQGGEILRAIVADGGNNTITGYKYATIHI
jgi:hypothetical protein